MTTPVALPAKEGHCEQCGLEITTGMMAALCPQARNCCMWPHAGGSYDPAVIDAELFMANAWIDNACEQIGLQIDERKRLQAELDAANMRLSDERAAHEDAVMVTVSKWRGEVAEIDAYAMELHDLLGKARSGLALVMSETGLGELFFRQVDAALAKNPEAVSKRLKEAEIASERPAEPMPTAGSNPASLDSPLTSARRYETLCPWCGHGECTGGCGRDFSRTMGEPK